MLHKNSIKNIFYLPFYSLVIELSRLIKISFILGSTVSFFSAVNILAPMAGILGGTYRGLSIFFVHTLLKWTFIGGGMIPLIGYHIPHFFASFYWNSRSKSAKIIIPLICMIVFIIHPVGIHSIPYALLWLIPISIALFNKNNIFLKALGSTFTAHAIGSVIWIYNIPMTPEKWIGLIPVALTERILFASGIVILYFVLTTLKITLAKKTSRVNFSTLFRKIN